MAVLENMEGDDSGDKDWLLQMRNLIQNAIYNISYMRGLFSEEYFRDTTVSESGLIVKKLIPKDVESRRLIDWIEQGVDDALQKKYLETVVFRICDKNEGATLDEYSFTFRYPRHDEAVMEFSLTGSKENDTTFKSNPAESTDVQIRSLIRICATMMNTLDPIPDERTILMKLMYYDDMTPEDYEPPLFEFCLDEDDNDLAQSFGRLCCISERAPILLIDSGASHHICCDGSYITDMINISKKKQVELTTADGGKFKAKEEGVIDIGSIRLSQVRYIPEMKFNVVSIGYLDKQGLLISIVNSQIFIIDVSKGIHVGEGYRHRKNNDYILKAMKWMVQNDVELQQKDDDSESWIIDSCCASHMAGNLAMITDPKPFRKEFYTPYGSMVSSHIGSVRTPNVQLSGVLYCPDNPNNLISVGLLDSQGHRFVFFGGMCTIVCKETLEEVGCGMLHDSSLLYHLQRLQTKNVNSKGKRKK